MLMAKILVVDDNVLNLTLAAELLKAAGQDVLQAESGEAGIRTALAEHPDLILMDLHMPGMDGIEAARRLRQAEATRDIPIVAVTAYPEKWAKARTCREAGFQGCIGKPVHPDSFAGDVLKYLRNASEQRA